MNDELHGVSRIQFLTLGMGLRFIHLYIPGSRCLLFSFLVNFSLIL